MSEANFLGDRAAKVVEMDGSPEKERLAGEIYDEIQGLPVKKNWIYHEPSDLDGIKAARLEDNVLSRVGIKNYEELYNKIYGAWLGRCAGCLLGQPVESWHRERIIGLLKDTGNYPMKYYISSDIPPELRVKYEVKDEGNVYASARINWINNVSHMPEDDDTNYTIIGLKLFEQYGSGFTPDDVAECWLANLPILHVCTAERVAYINLVNRVYPPESASYRNPCREWIGAQIIGGT